MPSPRKPGDGMLEAVLTDRDRLARVSACSASMPTRQLAVGVASLAAVASLTASVAPAAAEVRRISSSSQLTAALRSASPGDTLQLSSGRYAPVRITEQRF